MHGWRRVSSTRPLRLLARPRRWQRAKADTVGIGSWAVIPGCLVRTMRDIRLVWPCLTKPAQRYHPRTTHLAPGHAQPYRWQSFCLQHAFRQLFLQLIASWAHARNVVLQPTHIPGRLNWAFAHPAWQAGRGLQVPVDAPWQNIWLHAFEWHAVSQLGFFCGCLGHCWRNSRPPETRCTACPGLWCDLPSNPGKKVCVLVGSFFWVLYGFKLGAVQQTFNVCANRWRKIGKTDLLRQQVQTTRLQKRLSTLFTTAWRTRRVFFTHGITVHVWARPAH